MPVPSDNPPQPTISIPSHQEDNPVPFSSFFDPKFDLATLEATAQLADRTVFVTSNGRRYRLESIPDNTLPSSSSCDAPPSYMSSTQHNPLPSQQQQAAPEYQPYQRPYMAVRRKPVSNNAIAPSRAPLEQPGLEVVPSPAIHDAPEVLPDDMAAMMGHLNIHRFGAKPLYGESDGGVQAAETLTESHPGYSFAPDSPAYLYARQAQEQAQAQAQWQAQSQTQTNTQIQYSPPMQAYQDDNGRQTPGMSGGFRQIDYGNFMAQAQLSRPQRLSTGTLPSLLEFATPAGSYSGGGGRESLLSPVTTLGPYDGYMAASFGPHRPSMAPPPFVITPPAARHSLPDLSSGLEAVNFIDIDSTPIVVAEPVRTASSDAASINRDNVLPGEELLFDGPVKSSSALVSPCFVDGQLKMFRNTLTNDLRFHCRTGNDSETYWLKAAKAQLVPLYAYDSRFPNVLYLRDIGSDTRDNSSYAQQGLQGNGRSSGVYQFSKLAELCDFQAKLTGEKVVLDIGSVRLVRISRMNSRSSETYSSVRIQIWHQTEGHKGAQSDGASFVTAGTALSGPQREKMLPNSSRIMVYLGRLNEYITVFITDDIDIKADGPTTVKLKVRKAGPFSKRGSRWPGIKARLIKMSGSEPAGLDVGGKAANPDAEGSFDLYKTFEIDFESSPSQDNFLRKWDEIIKERRIQRKRLEEIQEEMNGATFSSKTARAIW